MVTEVIPLLPGRPTRGNAHLDIAGNDVVVGGCDNDVVIGVTVCEGRNMGCVVVVVVVMSCVCGCY